MNIPLLPSEKMDSFNDKQGLEERRLIRMPYEFREFVDYDIGEIVYARCPTGQIITLTVAAAYEEDGLNEELSAYVTTDIYNLITDNKSNVADVEPVTGITLGCDPELMLVNSSGTVIPASRFLRKYDAVGYDGLLLELRPFPSTDEWMVTQNLYNLIQQAGDRIPKEFRMIAVSSYHAHAEITPKYTQFAKLTAGFHLHYGLPKELLGYPKKFIADQIVKALDYYVGLPAIIPESDTDSYRRSVPFLDYGKPGTYRIDSRTLEYRVPGGILMRHPTWACGLIALGAVVIEDLVARIKHSSSNFDQLAMVGNDETIRFLYPNLPPAMEIFGAICSPNAVGARNHLDRIKSDVEKMVSYAARATAVNEFFNSLENKYPPDVQENWWRHYNGQRQSATMDVL